MQSSFTRVVVFFGIALVAGPARQAVVAHPGSGIAVDSQGQVYFVHTGVGVLRVDRDGQVVRHEGPGYHFLALDPDGRFARQRWPRFPDGVIESVGTSPKLLLASSFPLVVGPDGALYYPEAKDDGRVHMMRVTPGDEPATFAVLPLAMETGPDGEPIAARWIHGLTAGRDGTLYYAEKHAVRRIDRDGSVSLVAGDIEVPDCTAPASIAREQARQGPVLRGLDVAADGSLYVAASGCSAVLKIAPDGEVSVVLRSADAWSPTGIDVAGSDVYVLEFRYIEVERSADWLPRVRKLSADGSVTVLATVQRTESP